MNIFFISYTKKFLALLLTSIVTLVIIFFISNVTNSENFKREEILKNEVDRFLLEIYAINGEYPLNIKYLEEFGLNLEDTKFIYEYNFISKYEKPTVNIYSK